MKSISCVVVALSLATLAGCAKSNDVPELQSEAVALTKYYQPKVEDLGHRIDMIIKHGQVPPTTPGIGEAGALLKGADEKLREIRMTVVAGADGKSSIEKQAETLAKAGDTSGLEKLIDESREKLEDSTTIVDDRLSSVESWLANAQAGLAATPAPPPPPQP